MHTRRIRKLALAATAAAVVLGAVVPGGGLAQAATPTGIVSPVTGRIATVEDLVSSPAVVDYDHPNLTVTGRMRIYDPATETYAAQVGGIARLFVNGYGYADGAVASDGTFSARFRVLGTVTGVPWVAKLHWHPNAATTTAFGSAFPNPVPAIATWDVTPAASSWLLVLDQTSVTVKEPAAARLTGSVQRRVDGAWQKQPNVTVLAGGAVATTNYKGDFVLTPTPTSDGTLNVTLGYTNQLFIRPGEIPEEPVTVDVVPASTLRWTVRTVAADRSVMVRGSLSFNRANAPAGTRTIYLQRSTNGATSWTTQGFVRTYDAASRFEDKVRVKNVSGYFRLLYKGSTTVQGNSSPVYQLARREARIGQLSITPTTIDKGDYVRFSGTVQKRLASGTYSQLGKRVKVEVTFRRSLSDTKGVVSSHWTTSTGSFSFKKRVSSAGYWSVQWRSTIVSLVNAYGAERRIRIA